MALSEERLKTLALQMAAAMPEPPPRRIEIVAGELVSAEAMAIARTYEKANQLQRVAPKMGGIEMAINPLLVEQLTEIMRETPQRMEVIGVTGELLSEDAMRLARAFDTASGPQQSALLAVIEAFER